MHLHRDSPWRIPNMPPINMESLEFVLLRISEWSANCRGSARSTSTR